MLSHGAIIAREFGIPSVVGIADATRLHPARQPWCTSTAIVGLVRVMADGVVIARLPRASASGRSFFGPGRHPAVAAASWPAPASTASALAIDIACALLLLAQFRLWDDLADRETRSRGTPVARAGQGARASRPSSHVCWCWRSVNIVLAAWLQRHCRREPRSSRSTSPRPRGTPGARRRTALGDRSHPAREVPRLRRAPRRRLDGVSFRSLVVSSAAAIYGLACAVRALARRFRTAEDASTSSTARNCITRAAPAPFLEPVRCYLCGSGDSEPFISARTTSPASPARSTSSPAAAAASSIRTRA